MNAPVTAAIVSAIVSRDPDGAEAAVLRHLNAAWKHGASDL
jgi:DNA-binding GntR family transcriptional regulator